MFILLLIFPHTSLMFLLTLSLTQKQILLPSNTGTNMPSTIYFYEIHPLFAHYCLRVNLYTVCEKF